MVSPAGRAAEFLKSLVHAELIIDRSTSEFWSRLSKVVMFAVAQTENMKIELVSKKYK